MIRIDVSYQNEKLMSLVVKGHANSDEYGKDLICAAVSAILTGGFNAFNKEDIKFIKLQEGDAEVTIEDNEHARVVLETILIQLETIKQAYPNKFKINERRCTL